MHTPLCKHAVGQPGEYAAEAERIGLIGIIVTCHNPIPGGYSSGVRMAEAEFETYVEMVEAARQEWAGKIDVRLGLECDFAPGLEEGVDAILEQAEFHHILGSIHYQIGEYRKKYFYGSWFEYQKVYFDHLAQAAETGLFDTIAHPDLIKNGNLEEWDFKRIQPWIERALDRIAATGVAMELNTSGLLKSLPEMHPGPEYLTLMRARNIPVVVGADAHCPERTGDHFVPALENLLDAGYEEVSIFLNRERQDLSISKILPKLRNPTATVADSSKYLAAGPG